MPLLDISPLEKSVAALGRAADALAETPQSHPHYEHLRAAVVLNFQIVSGRWSVHTRMPPLERLHEELGGFRAASGEAARG